MCKERQIFSLYFPFVFWLLPTPPDQLLLSLVQGNCLVLNIGSLSFYELKLFFLITTAQEKPIYTPNLVHIHVVTILSCKKHDPRTNTKTPKEVQI